MWTVSGGGGPSLPWDSREQLALQPQKGPGVSCPASQRRLPPSPGDTESLYQREALGTQPECADLLPSPRTCCLIMLVTHGPPHGTHRHAGLFLLVSPWHSCPDTSPSTPHARPAWQAAPDRVRNTGPGTGHCRSSPLASRSGKSLDPGLNSPEPLSLSGCYGDRCCHLLIRPLGNSSGWGQCPVHFRAFRQQCGRNVRAPRAQLRSPAPPCPGSSIP